MVNGQPLSGYVDSGCSAVTIRQTDVDALNLVCEPTFVRLLGYGGGSTVATSKVLLNLKVDLAIAQVEALVVPNHVQQVPMIIGQPFINNKNVTVIVKGDQIRLYNHLNNAESRKLKLCVENTTVIPPNYVGHITISGESNSGDVFVDFQQRNWPNNAHIILPCVINLKESNFLPVINMSDEPLRYEKGRVIARGYTCYEDSNAPSLNCLRVEVNKCPKFTINDVKEQINAELSHDQLSSLLKLLNEYRDCFATSVREVGKTNVTKMAIKLLDDEPVTYRPYRMAFSNREKVRKIVHDLLEDGIIRDSESPYASPILLVKKKNGAERMCVDYRALNRKTVKDKYPLPRIDDLLDNIEGNSFYTTLDLASGYHQIPVAEDSISKTAFVTSDGHFEYLR